MHKAGLKIRSTDPDHVSTSCAFSCHMCIGYNLVFELMGALQLNQAKMALGSRVLVKVILVCSYYPATGQRNHYCCCRQENATKMYSDQTAACSSVVMFTALMQ